MLERFVKLKVPIQKAMIDLKINQELSESEYQRLADLSKVFEILKVTVEELCKRTASLITADTALKFMFTRLDAMQHDFSAAKETVRNGSEKANAKSEQHIKKLHLTLTL
ncbi:hypothetical protein PYW08_006295 [Mythimna loreyi]|uniref:Uncharacterized protein n=1 Tax=Mythimna loreyi TaxID=667449 RepID=A0ACC2QMR6_9NEOP|nr:hypothetical protein PYW08_006295 [Mythimna loreyi]